MECLFQLFLRNAVVVNLSVRRQDQVAGERTIVFSAVEGIDGELHVTDLVAITLLSGDNRQGRAKLRDRFILYDTGEVIYTARILSERSDMSVTKEYILKNFNLIYTDWNA